MKTFKMPKHLASNCSAVCRSTICPQMIKRATTGRYYITIGHAGFNTDANNANGYATRDAALRDAVSCATTVVGY